jgi:hypothetical protein
VEYAIKSQFSQLISIFVENDIQLKFSDTLPVPKGIE